MSLTLKKEKRQNLSKLKVFVEDNSRFSPNYFKVSDVPQILQKGKNLIRIKGNSDNLVAGSQILIDVRDANGNEIFFEVPDFIEDDKGRLISIFVYHDKGIDNTPNGDARITIVGTAKFDLNGNPIPRQFKNRPNVRWSEVVSVDRNRDNTTEILFNTSALPTIVVSESIESYTDIPQSAGLPTKTTTTGADAKYLLKGKTPIVKTSTSTPFNQEMVDGTLFLHSFANPARPEPRIKNPTNITSYTSSIAEILDNQTVRLTTPFTTTFDNRVGLTHRFTDIQEASYKIEHFSTGSNTTSDIKRAFANITISGSDPMVGVVDKVKVLIKSDGLVSDDELLNEVSVPFSSSYLLKIPVPSEHLNDVQKIKIQYLNSIGNISRTETVSDAIAFQGSKDRAEGTLGGFAITTTTISSSVEISSSIPALEIHAAGGITGSGLLIRQNYDGTMYSLIDTATSVFDGANIGRQLVSDRTEYTRSAVEDAGHYEEVYYWPVTLLEGETHFGIGYQAVGIRGNAENLISGFRFLVASAITASTSTAAGNLYEDSWGTAHTVLTTDITVPVTEVSRSISVGPEFSGNIVAIPTASLGTYSKIVLSLRVNDTGGGDTNTSFTKIKNIAIFASREFAGEVTARRVPPGK